MVYDHKFQDKRRHKYHIQHWDGEARTRSGMYEIRLPFDIFGRGYQIGVDKNDAAAIHDEFCCYLYYDSDCLNHSVGNKNMRLIIYLS